eukprot:283930-Hanusia_phi.AAC.2
MARSCSLKRVRRKESREGEQGRRAGKERRRTRRRRGEKIVGGEGLARMAEGSGGEGTAEGEAEAGRKEGRKEVNSCQITLPPPMH